MGKVSMVFFFFSEWLESRQIIHVINISLMIKGLS